GRSGMSHARANARWPALELNVRLTPTICGGRHAIAPSSARPLGKYGTAEWRSRDQTPMTWGINSASRVRHGERDVHGGVTHEPEAHLSHSHRSGPGLRTA